ncbi:hypothetical protein DINM_003100 [Dirofilaria immitis]|nr:hypothetical protein [Dirofilaria immitis]
MERILRQLDAISEDLQHSIIEAITESKLLVWILDKVETGIKAVTYEIVIVNTYLLDHLTNKLQVVNANYDDLSNSNVKKNQQRRKGVGENLEPDILIGTNYFFDFMEPYEIHVCYLDSNWHSQRTPNTDKFWKLELIGIYEQSNAQDDDETLEQFKKLLLRKVKDTKSIGRGKIKNQIERQS